ncbi:MAG: penicillin-binding protein 2 [Elusimicrobia bacterium]|nr:MAG: penicillin-binding protein 2 [Elusimicrobiota bacterium]
MAHWDRGLQDRLNFLWIACYVGSAILGVRLLHIQVIRNVYYARVAESNRTQIIHQSAPRGIITDRRGRVIVTSKPAFSLIYLPGETQDASRIAGLAKSLAKELREDSESLHEKLKEAHEEEAAIHLAENLPLKTMFKLSELKTIYPGVDLIVEARRYYPNGATAGHLLGYMGRMDKRSWRRLRAKGYRKDSWIGKTGLESKYERQLRGVDGESRMEVDAQGHLKRKIGESLWSPGANLHLTLDLEMQKAAEEGLRASPSGMGGVVVLDPRNGAILALASTPDYDPNLFLLSGNERPKDYLKNLPEFNRAIQGTYSPGSTFKMLVGVAMLESGVKPDEKVYCSGKFRLGRRSFACLKKTGHGPTDWMRGITQSCNVYFYTMGLRAKGANIERFSKMFGFGKKTGSGLKGEKGGNLFGPEARKSKKKGWYEGDTVNLSIGQGELLVTPIQMAVYAAALANRGTLWRPYVVSKIVYSDGTEEPAEKAEKAGVLDVSDDTWDLISKGMRSVVTNGTGRRVNIPGIDVRGKTGTAQNPLGEDHAWFVAFAGREGEEPSLALAVLVQFGGHGSSAAGPIARRIIETAFAPREDL